MSRIFELRTYHAAPGRMAELESRFRDHTLRLFARHGIEVVNFFRSADEPEARLVYLCAFADRAAATAAWDAFRADPDWVKVKTETEAQGTLVRLLESEFLEPTDYSTLQ